MKSRISFFNRTVFFKNLKLYCPISLVYFILLILYVPVRLVNRFESINRVDNMISKKEKLSEIYEAVVDVLDLELHTAIIFVVAIILVMALFSYMFSAKSANMMHALPITRKELFGTNAISGFLFMLLPQFLTFIITQMVLLMKGFADIKVLGVWFLCIMGISLFAFSFAVFCAMFTGQMFALPLYYGIINVLYVGARSVVTEVINQFVVGTEATFSTGTKLDWLSPFYFICGNVSISPIYESGYRYIIGAKLYTGNMLLLYAIVSLFLLAVAYGIYRRRPIEKAGDLLTISFVKPIFRWGVGICVGFWGSLWVMNLLSSKPIRYVRTGYIILILVLGVVGFFVAEMFIKKTFKVLCKKRLLECIAFMAVMLGCFEAMALGGKSITKQLPALEDIHAAYLVGDYTVECTDINQIQDILDLNHIILEDYREFPDSDDASSFSLGITYVIKDGTTVDRDYFVYCTKEEKAYIGAMINKYERDPENIAKYTIGDNPEALIETVCEGEYSFYNSQKDIMNQQKLDEEQAKAVAKAIYKDIQEGNFNDLYSTSNTELSEDKIAEVALKYIIEDVDLYSDVALRSDHTELGRYFMNQGYRVADASDDEDAVELYRLNSIYQYYYKNLYNEYRMRKSITIGEQCVNTVETLESFGLNIF